MLFAYTVWQRQLPYCIYSGNEWHYAWYFFFFTRCIFSDIIRLNNLIFQVICRFRHLNSNIISFAMIFFTQNFTKISDDIFGIWMSIFFRSEKKMVKHHSAFHYMSISILNSILKIIFFFNDILYIQTYLSCGTLV